MNPRRVGTGLLLVALLVACAPRATAAPPAAPSTEELRQQALQDVAGEDMAGKDGPLAKVGFDLALLRREYEAFLSAEPAQEGADFQPSNPGIRVSDGLVLIEAVASGDTAALLADLELLGFVDAASFGRQVSGRLPISVIAEMAALESLQFARPAMAMTQ